MFETAVGDGAKEFSFEQEIAETSRVNANVAALLVGGRRAGACDIAFLRCAVRGRACVRWSCGIRGLQLLIGVVDEILLVRHGDGFGMIGN